MPINSSTGVQLGDVRLYAYEGQPADEYGTYWGLTQLDGWFDGWEGTGVVTQRPQAPGAYVSPQYAGPRVIHLGGSIRDTSWDGVTRAWDRLLAQIPFQTLAAIEVSTGEGSVAEQTTLVRQHEKPILSERFEKRANFSLSLLAPDPRKYATTTQDVDLVLPATTGGLTPPLTPPLTPTGSSTVSEAVAYNDGTTDAPVTITIPGPCPSGAVIANTTTGQAIVVTDAIGGSETLVIDTASGSASVGGQARPVRGTFWSLAPGANTISFFATGGYDPATVATVAWRSAWK